MIDQQTSNASAAMLGWLPLDGEVPELVRRHSWSQTATGDPSNWTMSLKALLGVMLASRQAAFLVWGQERAWFYNDAFIPIMGAKHPAAIGQHALDAVWREMRDALHPLFEKAFAGEAVHTDGLALEIDRMGALERAYVNLTCTPVRDGSGEVVGLFGTCTEILDHVAPVANGLYRQLMDAVPGVIYAKDREGRFLAGNAGTAQLLGKRYDEFIGRTDLDVLEDKSEAAALMANDRRIMERGIAEVVEEKVTLPDGTRAWWLSNKAPLLDQANRVVGIVGSSVDITDRRLAEEQRVLLLEELSHRVKNTLAVIQAMARQTFRDPTPLDQLESFDARLASLAQAHSLITDKNWASANLRDVVIDQLEPKNWGARLVIAGPDVPLPSRVALNLGLILHELCTNATKYGALSNDEGAVEINWRVSPDHSLVTLRWTEVGGPPVVVPKRTGFGSRMIERALAAERAQVSLNFLPGGLVCEIQMPIAA